METMGRTVLTSQFVARLLPELKSNVAGSEGDFERLLVKARFEEDKLRDLSPSPKKKTQPTVPSQDASNEQESQPLAKSTPSGQTWCRKCQSHHHHWKQHPLCGRSEPREAPGQKSSTKQISAVTATPPSTQEVDSEGDAVNSALDEAMATMYGVTPTNSPAAATLGPTIRTQVMLEGESVEALVDTGSPATIVSLKCIIDVLARKRPPGQSPQQWREAVQKRLQKPSIPLRNYGGGELNLVRELEVEIERAGYSIKSVIQIHVGASVELLLGTDVLPHLGFLVLARSTGGTTEDLLMTAVLESPRDGGAIVQLLQTVKVPPQHKKVVHA